MDPATFSPPEEFTDAVARGDVKLVAIKNTDYGQFHLVFKDPQLAGAMADYLHKVAHDSSYNHERNDRNAHNFIEVDSGVIGDPPVKLATLSMDTRALVPDSIFYADADEWAKQSGQDLRTLVGYWLGDDNIPPSLSNLPAGESQETFREAMSGNYGTELGYVASSRFLKFAGFPDMSAHRITAEEKDEIDDVVMRAYEQLFGNPPPHNYVYTEIWRQTAERAHNDTFVRISSHIIKNRRGETSVHWTEALSLDR